MSRAVLISILQGVIWVVLMAIVMRWVSRSRIRATGDAPIGEMAHPKSTLVTGLVCTAFFVTLTVMSTLVWKDMSTPWVTVCFASFSLLCGFVLVDYRYARHKVTEEGIEYGRMLRSRGEAKWSDVTRVHYSQGLGWFVLTLKDGSKIHISVLLTGLPEFARLALLKVAPEFISAATRTRLEETATGKLPSIWS
jgi:hypothetical protein